MKSAEISRTVSKSIDSDGLLAVGNPWMRARTYLWYQWRYHSGMAMTLRLTDDETEALRRRAELERRSMQEVARQAIREYVENHSRAELLDRVLDEELPRYAEALERLGQ
jgi:ribbon-helix-helix CopG family protein